MRICLFFRHPYTSKVPYILSLSLILLGFTFMSNESQARGIIDQQAPAWGVTEWVQLPAGKTSLDITDFVTIQLLIEQEVEEQAERSFC